MADQKRLFDEPPVDTTYGTGPLAKASARKTDPDTSHEAAEKMNESGKADVQRMRCLSMVREHEGLTSAEIGQMMGTGRYMPARRLPELERAGLVSKGKSRRCRVCGSRCVTWYEVKQ